MVTRRAVLIIWYLCFFQTEMISSLLMSLGTCRFISLLNTFVQTHCWWAPLYLAWLTWWSQKSSISCAQMSPGGGSCRERKVFNPYFLHPLYTEKKSPFTTCLLYNGLPHILKQLCYLFREPAKRNLHSYPLFFATSLYSNCSHLIAVK